MKHGPNFGAAFRHRIWGHFQDRVLFSYYLGCKPWCRFPEPKLVPLFLPKGKLFVERRHSRVHRPMLFIWSRLSDFLDARSEWTSHLVGVPPHRARTTVYWISVILLLRSSGHPAWSATPLRAATHIQLQRQPCGAEGSFEKRCRLAALEIVPLL